MCKKTIDQFKKDYRVWCMVHNKTPNQSDFKGYIADQRMLEKIKKYVQSTALK